MDKRGQLGWIEFKFFLIGFVLALIALYVVFSLAKHKVIPFNIPIL